MYHCYHHIQTILYTFIWEKKGTASENFILYTPLKLSGMGAPDVSKFYKVAILTQNKHWWTSLSDTSWKQIEAHTLKANLIFLLSASLIH